MAWNLSTPFLDEVAAQRAVDVFDRLRLPDVTGKPLLKEASGDWFREIVRVLHGSIVNVKVMNYGNDNVSVNQKQNSNGGVELMVGQAAASQMAKKGSALRQVTDNRALLASR